MHEMPDKVLTWGVEEMHLLRDADVGAGYVATGHGHLPDAECAGTEVIPTPVVFALLTASTPGRGDEKHALNLILTPADAARLAMQLLEMGAAAAGMPSKPPTDIVDR